MQRGTAPSLQPCAQPVCASSHRLQVQNTEFIAKLASLEVELAVARSEYAQELEGAGDLHAALFSRVDSMVEEAEGEEGRRACATSRTATCWPGSGDRGGATTTCR